MFLLLLLLYKLTLNIPPPPKKKNWREIVAFLMIVLRQNLSLIFLRNSRKIGRFFRKFLSKNPSNLIFSATYQRPCVMSGLKILDLVAFFSISAPPFFSFTNVNNIQSYFKKVKVWITLEA